MPLEGDTSEARSAPSFAATALLSDAINSLPRRSLQNGCGLAVVVACRAAGVCVSVGVGGNVGEAIKAGCVVAVMRAVGGGGASTGIEHAVMRVVRNTLRNILLSFIAAPFNKKLAECPPVPLYYSASSAIFFATRLITSATPPTGFLRVSNATSTISGAMRLMLRKRRAIKFSSGFGSSSAVCIS